ncbi:MAG: hypothetical protein ACRCXC_12590 [Legionella sp.]
MSRKKLNTVDNSGKGNCLYYSYGISLMYYLRKKGDIDSAERIFERLGLGAPQKAKLFYVLENEKNKSFTMAHIVRIIETILGPALRQYAASMTGANFLNNPRGSSLFTAANYGMIYLFKKELQKNKNTLATLLKSNHFSDKDYTKAEIFRVDKICQKMKGFWVENYEQIINEFEAEWPQRAQDIHSKNPQKTFEEISDDDFYKRQLLEEIIGNMTIQFFLTDENKNLKSYVDHLNTDYRWGTEETLMLLHSQLQGERHERLAEDYVEITYDTPMSLQIYRNGKPYFSSSEHGAHDIILNNSSNKHWLSLINSRSLTIKRKEVLRNDLLDLIGFNGYLQQFLEKAEDLAEKYSTASEQAYLLHKKLTEVKELFLVHDSEMTRVQFVDSCNELLSNPELTSELQKHRGVKDTFSKIINCLYLIVTFDFSDLFSGKLDVINPLNTDSMYRVGLLKQSLQDLNESDLPDINTPRLI